MARGRLHLGIRAQSCRGGMLQGTVQIAMFVFPRCCMVCAETAALSVEGRGDQNNATGPTDMQFLVPGGSGAASRGPLGRATPVGPLFVQLQGLRSHFSLVLWSFVGRRLQPTSCDVSRFGPDLGHCGVASTKIWRCRPNLVRTRSSLAWVGPEFGDSGRVWFDWVHVLSMSAEIGPGSTKFWRFRPKLARLQPTSARFRPNLGGFAYLCFPSWASFRRDGHIETTVAKSVPRPHDSAQ